MTPIPVRAHGAIGVGHLILAVGFLAVAGVYADWILGLIGVLNLGLAYSWSTTPTFTLFQNRIEVYNRFGGIRRQILVRGLGQLELRGRQLYLPDTKLPAVDATLGRAQDWARVVAAIEAASDGSTRSSRSAPSR